MSSTQERKRLIRILANQEGESESELKDKFCEVVFPEFADQIISAHLVRVSYDDDPRSFVDHHHMNP